MAEALYGFNESSPYDYVAELGTTLTHSSSGKLSILS